MGGHATTLGEDDLRGRHAGKVLGAGLNAHHDYPAAIFVPSLCVVGMEHDLSTSRTRTGGKPLRDDLGLGERHLVEHGVEKLVELVGLATLNGSLLVDDTISEQVHGNLHHGRTRALAIAGLEEPELALLYGELHILHVAVVVLQLLLDVVELLEYLGHRLLH